MNRKKSIFLFVLLFILYVSDISGEISDREELFNMTLEELMDLEIKFGTLTGIEQSKFPGNIIIISEEEIEKCPARNLLDIIEIYVPGATYVMHYKGFRLGFRGMLSDQNYSYQLLINGKNLNSRAFYGPLFELQERDLNGIEKIEIISGPGSAVYGPGATAGIINIITKKARVNQLAITTSKDLNYQYDIHSLEFSRVSENLKYNFYGSVSSSKGLEETKFWYIDRAHNAADNIPWGWGYMSPEWGNYNKGTNVPALLGDYQEKPEIKLDFNLEYKDRFDFQTRYSTYNHAFMTQENASEEGRASAGTLGKYVSSELKWKTMISEKGFIESKLGFQSKSIREVNLFQGENLPYNHIAQRGNSYSENNIDFHALFHYDLDKNIRLAFGGEASYEYYEPEWGLGDDTFIMSLQYPIRFAVLNSNSGFYKFYGDEVATIIDEKMDGRMYSAFGEANLKLSERFQLLLSSRLDKHEYSEYAFSPRIALITQISPKQQVDLILEQALRLPLFTDLFSQHYLDGEKAKPEKLRGAEVQYSYFPNKNLEINLGSYYYQIDQIGWVNETVFSDQIGTFELAGLEPEIRYKTSKFFLGANYSYINQLSWENSMDMDAWLEGLNGEKIYLDDYGENRINNFPAQAFKCYGNFDIAEDISLNLNGRIMWDFQQNEMLEMFEDAQQEYGNDDTIEVLNEIIDDLYEHGYGKPSFTTNALIQWDFSKNQMDMSFQLYAMNLLSHNQIRYVIQFWEPGGLRMYPRQCGFIDEPITIGCNLKLKI